MTQNLGDRTKVPAADVARGKPRVPTPDAAPEGEEIQIIRPRALPGVELWTIRRSMRSWAMFHTTYAFCVPRRLEGRVSWRYSGRTHDLGLTSTAALRPSEFQTTRQEAPADIDMLLVSPVALEHHLGPEFNGQSAVLRSTTISENTGLVAQFDRLTRSLSSAEDSAEQVARLQIYLRAVKERMAGDVRTEPANRCSLALERVQRILIERFSERITLDDLAADTGFSKFYLERNFNERFGLPIHQALKRVRLARAMDLLRQGERPSAVARAVGFADQPHLSRVFREEFGISPRTFAAGATGSKVGGRKRGVLAPPVDGPPSSPVSPPRYSAAERGFRAAYRLLQAAAEMEGVPQATLNEVLRRLATEGK